MRRLPKPDWSKLREALWLRCGGYCEVSGTPLDFDTFDAHHRRNKGMGGDRRLDTNTLPNLLALDPQVHNGGPTSVHGRRPWSQRRGYLIPKDSQRPAGAFPVKIHGRRWVLLLDDGTYGLARVTPE